MSFQCSKCGLCCQNINQVRALDNYHNGDGICKHYSFEKGCKIYDQRPLVCRIDEGYQAFFISVISLDEYYQKNAEVCNQLQEQCHYDEIYRVVIKK